MHSEEALCRSFKYRRQYQLKNSVSSSFSFKICIIEGKTLTSVISVKTNSITGIDSISSGVRYYGKYIGPKKNGICNCHDEECQKKYTEMSNKNSKEWRKINKRQKEKSFSIRMGEENNKTLSSQTIISIHTRTEHILIKPLIYYSGKTILLRP